MVEEDLNAELQRANTAWQDERREAEKRWKKRRDAISSGESVPDEVTLAVRAAERDVEVAKKTRLERRKALEKQRDAAIAKAKGEFAAATAGIEADVRKAKDKLDATRERHEKATREVDARVRERATQERPTFFAKERELREKADAVAQRIIDGREA